jgi:hypothetical protein
MEKGRTQGDGEYRLNRITPFINFDMAKMNALTPQQRSEKRLETAKTVTGCESRVAKVTPIGESGGLSDARDECVRYGRRKKSATMCGGDVGVSATSTIQTMAPSERRDIPPLVATFESAAVTLVAAVSQLGFVNVRRTLSFHNKTTYYHQLRRGTRTV